MAIDVKGRVETISGRGVAGVLVSNGERIEVTDDAGCYSIEVEPGIHRFVFITFPDGFQVQGSFFRSVIDMKAEGEMDFRLVRIPDAGHRSFSVAHITDTHVSCEEDGARSWTKDVLPRDIKKIVGEDHPDLIIASGDLTRRGKVSQLEIYRQTIEGASIPVLSVFGGHDGNEERHSGEPGTTFTRNYERILGPVYYSFDRGGRHFVLYAKEDHFFSPEDQERKDRWFWQDLGLQPKDREIVLVMHTPPPSSFLDQLAPYPVKLVLYGHWHSNRVYTYRNIIVAATQPLPFGGIDTVPRGYRLVRFDEKGFHIKLRHLTARDKSKTTNDAPRGLLTSGGRLKLLWQTHLRTPIHRAAPAMYEDSLLISLGDEDDGRNSGIRSIDSRTGGLNWQIRTDSSIKNSVATSKGLCTAVSVTGRLYLVDISSGRMGWCTDLPGFPDRWIYTSPVMGSEAVYAGAKQGYGAYDIDKGSQLWYSQIESNDAWSCYASPQLYKDLIIVLVQRRGLLALDNSRGTVAWEAKMPVEYHYSSPVVAGDLIVSGGERENLAVLRADSGEILWQGGELLGRYPTGIAVGNDWVYTTTSDGMVQCNDLLSGQRYWSFAVQEDLLDMTPYRREVKSILAGPLIMGNDVIVCGCDGHVYVLDSASGACTERVSLGSPITATPCITGGGICVGTYDGWIYCFSG